MLRYFALLILIVVSLQLTIAQENLIQNVYNREVTDLDGYWKYIVDPYKNGFYNYRYEPFENQTNPGKGAFFTNAKREGKADLVEYDFDKMDSLKVPGDWNSQKEKLYYYEGTLWMKKSFNYSKASDENRVFVYFEASNYRTDIYLNGKKLGFHEGGFTPFNFEVTGLLKEKDNFLIVKIDNKRKKEAVPTLNTDWWNYGGLTRGVKLIETPSTFVEDYFIQLDQNDNKRIIVSGELNGPSKANQEVKVNIPEIKLTRSFYTDDKGKFNGDIAVDEIRYWSLEDSYLYKVELEYRNEIVEDKIGFRTIKTSGADILLNGKSIFLKGISVHEESPINGGRGHSRNDAKQLLVWAKELGCNYVRLAHYPHNEHMVRLADEMGMLVWEENPVYWTISWENQKTYLNAQNQLNELIERDKNRASVIIWSMANETPTSDSRNVFLNKLASFAKEKDSTRLISAALEQSNYNGDPLVRTISDSYAEVVDILSFNQYIGWYDGSVEKCRTISWKIDFDKPVIISEFGAGAKYGLSGDKDTRWTEEYQEYLYKETLLMIDQIDQLRGVSPWILVDFKSPRRVLPDVQDDYNRKGLISEKGEKKKAFFILKAYYEYKELIPK